MAEQMCRVTVLDGKPFTYNYDSVGYTVPTGRKGLVVPRAVGNHLCFHAAQGNRQLLAESVEMVAADRAPAEASASEFKDPETGETFPTLEALIEAVKARAAKGGK